MPASVTLSVGTLYAFLLVLARVSGALVFVPLPGVSGGPQPARAALAFGMTLALYGRWPAVNAGTVTGMRMVGWAVAEASVGIAIGVSVAIALEAFALAAQVLGLQAGYAYAQTIDPNTQGDSGILLVIAQLFAGMLFFSLGLDREILRLFAQSLDTVPAGTYVLGLPAAEIAIRLGASLFAVGVRLALPVVALLVMVDVALALMGRLNQQLQLLHLAFPAKMLTALLVFSWIAVLFPRVMWQFSGQAWTAARRILGIMTRHGGSEQDRTAHPAPPPESARRGPVSFRAGIRERTAVHGVSGSAGRLGRRLVCAVPPDYAIALLARVYARIEARRSDAHRLANRLEALLPTGAGRAGGGRGDARVSPDHHALRLQLSASWRPTWGV